MSSGNHDSTRNQPVFATPPEIPRRPAVTMNAAIPAPAPVRHERVREVHKNAWLKWLHTSYDKKGASLVKRSEKWWVVFCIHDDVDAFLEFYTEPKMAQIHKPATRISLAHTLHVSPSIVGQDNEFQFAVTFSSQVICLAATDWDQMLEWVDSLQGKLREMNILSPKDNLYSKLPETRICPINNIGAISTRDPNSPLPPTPNGYISTEFVPVHPLQPPLLLTGDNDAITNSQWGYQFRVDLQPTSSLSVPDDRAFELVSASTSVYVPSAGNGISFQRSNSGDTGNTSIVSIDTTENTGSIQSNPNNNAASTCPVPESSTVVVGTKTNNNSTLVQIEFANPVQDSPTSSTSSTLNTSESARECASNPNVAINQKCIRRNRPRANSRKSNTDPGVNFGGLLLSVPTSEPSSAEFTRQVSAPDQNARSASTEPPATRESSELVYEHLFTPVSTTVGGVGVSGVDTNNVQSNSGGGSPPVIPRRNPNGRRIPRGYPEPAAESRQRHALPATQSSSHLDLGGNAASGYGRNRQNRPRTNSQPPDATTEGSLGAVSGEESPLEGMIGLRRGEYRVSPARRNGIESAASKVEMSSTNVVTPISSGKSEGAAGSAHVPLKESQVMRLNSEISHKPGVRIVLRKRDCLNTIAFADYFGAVWIAGWKQQEHPVLYYAFHIGDQILKVGGTRVQSSEEVRRAIKMASTHQVEFIIRRLPYGKVFVLKRKAEGEPLGLIAVGNCSEISEVVPNSLAAAAGLSPQATSVDGQSPCSWFLTEINNRPLSLFARENEVRDRLNAVGKEISILVQPTDLVKHLKKQLKTIRGFKEYLVV